MAETVSNIQNYIGGELVPPSGGRYLDNFEPAVGRPYSKVPDSDSSDVDRAVLAAQKAFHSWSTTSAKDRARAILKLASLVERDLEPLSVAEARDTGKPISLARSLDIPRSVSNLKFFAGAVLKFHGEILATEDRAKNFIEYSPLGVVGCISPWNLPLYLFTWKIAPALAAGNCVVAKPSEITPMTAFMLSKLCIEAGLPSGVLNIVHGTGPGVGEAIVSHPLVKAISFTGSTAVGRRIAQQAAPSFKKVSLEMGGKNANIIFADADFENAVSTTVRSSFANQGQICLCGSRIFVERSIYSRFRDELVLRARALKIGDPLLDSTEQGSLVSRLHWEKVRKAVSEARAAGGKILCGGEVPTGFGDGYFFEPTLIEGLDHMCATNQEEIFGPVATLIPFDNENEVIEMANSTRYGLSASVWTGDLDRGQRVARALDAGVVWINTWMLRDLRTPFGGVKESGVGREGGIHALQFFSEVKNICVGLK